MLISTDVISRGIDIQQVALVMNYEIPRKFETYLHRMGRAGRFGKKGLVLNLVTEEERKQLAKIEKFYKMEIGEFIPS